MENEVGQLKSKDMMNLLRQSTREMMRSFVKSYVMASRIEEEFDRIKGENNRLKEAVQGLRDANRDDKERRVEAEKSLSIVVNEVDQHKEELKGSREGHVKMVEKYKALNNNFLSFKNETGVMVMGKLNDSYKAGYFRALSNAKVLKSDPIWKRHRSPFTPMSHAPRPLVQQPPNAALSIPVSSCQGTSSINTDKAS